MFPARARKVRAPGSSLGTVDVRRGAAAWLIVVARATMIVAEEPGADARGPWRRWEEAMTRWLTHSSPLGELILVSNGEALAGLLFSDGRKVDQVRGEAIETSDTIIDRTRRQLDAFFGRRRRDFDVPLAPQGTPFQLRVWRALQRVPYGEVASYGAIATAIRRPSASRAVGMANGANPIAIIVPCHRIIGASGHLTGYGGGLDRKRFLLALEQGQGQLAARVAVA